MTAVDHAELKRLAEGAAELSPNPWGVVPRERGPFGNESAFLADAKGDFVGTFDGDAEEAFAAAANPAVVLELLSEIEGLKAERDTARAGRSIIAGGSMDMAVMYASANERADAAEDALRTQAPDSWRPDREAVFVAMATAILPKKMRANCPVLYSASDVVDESVLGVMAEAVCAALRPQTAESGK